MKKEERTLYDIVTNYESTLVPDQGLPDHKTGYSDLLVEKIYGKHGLIRTVKAAYLKLKRKFPESPLLEAAKGEIDYLCAKYISLVICNYS